MIVLCTTIAVLRKPYLKINWLTCSNVVKNVENNFGYQTWVKFRRTYIKKVGQLDSCLNGVNIKFKEIIVCQTADYSALLMAGMKSFLRDICP